MALVTGATTMSFRIRLAEMKKDEQVVLRFIRELQVFEQAVESNRRLDAPVAQEFFSVLMARIQAKNGRCFIAEDQHGTALGWAAAHEDESEIYVAAEERIFGWISELYVTEAMRGRGVGRALMSACEAWGRERGLKLMKIGVLAGNTGAARAYAAAGYKPYSMDLRKYL
jgi:GNAT superfamily N-acetyltransferase